MIKTKFSPDQKIQIVLESIKTATNTAELCRKHNVNPQTFQTWRQKFMDAGKSELSRHGNKDPVKTIKKENDDLKRIIGEQTIVIDALKKPWRQTEIERSQTNPYSVESAQVTRVCKSLKAPVVLQSQTPRELIGSRHGGHSAQDKQGTTYIWYAAHGGPDNTGSENRNKPKANAAYIS